MKQSRRRITIVQKRRKQGIDILLRRGTYRRRQREIKNILSLNADTTIDDDLRYLTRYMTELGIDKTLLHGHEWYYYRYGADFENDVFMMHSFCWCYKHDCPWCYPCYCEIEEIHGEYVLIKECGNHDKETLPNFWYKPTNFRIHWYKYIGRGMEFNREIKKKQWKQLLEHCFSSLGFRYP